MSCFALPRDYQRIIVHFDYDCFYASVFEKENPALKNLPLAVQQKQIVVTCNYEARRRGLHKLQLIAEARRICPEVVVVLGEELGPFRDASKTLHCFLQSFSWNGRAEKLGFDEVFLDVTDMIDWNQDLLNPNDLRHSFFQLKRDDPTIGFTFDATEMAGESFPATGTTASNPTSASPDLTTRLMLGSHLAQHVRLALVEQQGFTSTVGISTNKVLSKLAGNVNKPNNQTVLLPPYWQHDGTQMRPNNVTAFIDEHDLCQIPGIGFKTAQRIRSHVLARPAAFETGLIHGGTRDPVAVREARLFPGMSAETLERLLGGPGAEKDVGSRIWRLLHGLDDAEVHKAKKVPSQISLEDSYQRLETMAQVTKELNMLARSLISRMHVDLLEGEDEATRRWIAHPKKIRLSTRPRPPLNPDGTRTRSFKRIHRTEPLPNHVFTLKESVAAIAGKLVHETLVPMFRRLHPPHGGWNLSLINVGVTHIVAAGSDDGAGVGRDIGRMFERQEEVLREWKIEDLDVPPDGEYDAMRVEPSAGDEAWNYERISLRTGDEEGRYEGVSLSTSDTGGKNEGVSPRIDDEVSNLNEGVSAITVPARHDQPTQIPTDPDDAFILTQSTIVSWDEEEDEPDSDTTLPQCGTCGMHMPGFAMPAHERFHLLGG